MSDVRAQMLRRESLRALAGACARALAADKRVHFRGSTLYQGEARLAYAAPHLFFETDHDATVHGLRALADGVGLRIRHSNADLHRELSPTTPLEKRIFDLLEQLRVESLIAPYMHGQASNVTTHFLRWSEAFHHSGLTETGIGLLLFTITQICWSRLTTYPIPEEIDGLIEGTRVNLAPSIGVALGGLRRHRFDQRLYARDAREIANVIGNLVCEETSARAGASERDISTRFMEALALFGELDAEQTVEGGTSGAHGAEMPGTTPAYRVYTRQYDRLSHARSLARPAEQKHHCVELDKLVAAAGIHGGCLARQMQMLLCSAEQQGWQGGHEEGITDPVRLAQFIATPSAKTIFKQPQRQAVANSVVTLLIDCSGSMKAHLPQLAVFADSVSRALDLISVQNEVLGFSTAAWNGGRARLEWLRQGAHAQPGRLNETHHIVFKAADEAWRHARPAIATLLKTDHCREGIDGEALAWACSRMTALPAKRRVLIFISDGCPMDGATLQANGESYLDAHLREVVSQYESAIELRGLGVGHDLSRYFKRCMGIDLGDAMDNRMLATTVGRLFARR